MDLADFWRGRISIRRLLVLADRLPETSSTAARLSGLARGWTTEALVTADVYHALTGEAHPARPKPRSEGVSVHASKAAALKAQRERVARQRAEAAQRIAENVEAAAP